MMEGEGEVARQYALNRYQMAVNGILKGIHVGFLVKHCAQSGQLPQDIRGSVRNKLLKLLAHEQKRWQHCLESPWEVLADKNLSPRGKDVDNLLSRHANAVPFDQMQYYFQWFLQNQSIAYTKLKLYSLLGSYPEGNGLIACCLKIPMLQNRLQSLYAAHMQHLTQCVQFVDIANPHRGWGCEIIYADENFNFKYDLYRCYSSNIRALREEDHLPGHGELMSGQASCFEGQHIVSSYRHGFAPAAQLSATAINRFLELPPRNSDSSELYPRIINCSFVRLFLADSIQQRSPEHYVILAERWRAASPPLEATLANIYNIPLTPHKPLMPDVLKRVWDLDNTKSHSAFNRICTLLDAQTIMVKAAGNDGDTLSLAKFDMQCFFGKFEFPQSEQVLVVGCYDLYGQKITPYSGRAGALKDRFILAPGHHHLLPRVDGTYVAFATGGTSISTALVSAIIADLYSKFRHLHARDICNAVLSTASRDIPGYTPEIHGCGVVNHAGALRYLNENYYLFNKIGS